MYLPQLGHSLHEGRHQVVFSPERAIEIDLSLLHPNSRRFLGPGAGGRSDEEPGFSVARAGSSTQNLSVNLSVGVDLSDVTDSWALDRPGELDDAQMNEFERHLIARASETFQAAGHAAQFGGAGLGLSVVRYKLSVPASTDCPDLVLLRDGTQVELYVVSHDRLDPTAIQKWVDAASGAMRDLGRKRDTIEWSAIIGGYARFGTLHRLDRTVVIRDVQLAPLPDAVTELVPGGSPTLGGGSIGSFWPVLVSGRINGYSWHRDAEVKAGSLTDLLCSYLSAVTPMTWRTRQAAMPVLGEEVQRGWRPPPLPFDEAMSLPLPTPERLDLPEWFDSGWERLLEDESLADAVRMFHEGDQLVENHPSLALVAFTSVVESIAQFDDAPRRCSECGQVTGSTKRFKRAISSVLPEEVAEMTADAYERRSGVVHRSLLHGGEGHRGVLMSPMFGRDPGFDFRWMTLRYTQDAARALLTNQLRQT